MLSSLCYLFALAAAVLGYKVNMKLLFVSLWIQINSIVSTFQSPNCRLNSSKAACMEFGPKYA